MMRAMSDAVSGLSVHQDWMDVIGNNIANVDTPGFKQSDMNFAAMFSQVLSTGSRPTATGGGTNPIQVGLGVTVGSTSEDQSAGALQSTGVPTNLALQGSGYFVLNGPQGTGYTRVGDFSVDANGNLVEGATGQKVMGWVAQNGVLPAQNAATAQDITLPTNQSQPPSPTTTASFAGNLDLKSTASTQAPITVYDSLGNTWNLNVTFSPSGTPDVWNWSATLPTGAGGTTTGGTVTFNTNGSYASMTGGPVTLAPTGAATQSIALNFSAVTQVASPSSVAGAAQNGVPSGQFTGLSIDNNGVISGHYSNGLTQTLGQVAVASVPNPQGLVQSGDGIYQTGNNSGTPQVGVAGTGGRGAVAAGYLEGSNVDLAAQFTQMIAAERGFQANTQVISTANTMLGTLVQL